MLDISEDLVRQLFAAEPEEPALLLTLEADGLDTPIRIASHPEAMVGGEVGITSRGADFLFCPFNFGWGGAGEGEPIRDAQLEIGNVDGRIALMVRQVEGRPKATVEMVRLSEPDVVERAMRNAGMVEVEIDGDLVTGALRPRDFAAEPACKASYNVGRTPGLF